jgi:hypothetical protein
VHAASPLGDEQEPPYPINITDIGRQNIDEKHRESSPYNVDRSTFRDDLSIDEIVEPAEYVRPELQDNGRWQRVVEWEAEAPVGWDRDGDPTWVYTVITEGPTEDGPQDLFNAFPGYPED